jgi:hypothetical protein
MLPNVVDLKIQAPTLPTPGEFAQLLRIAESAVIENAQDSVDLQSQRAKWNADMKATVEERLEITRKIDAAKKAIMDLYEPKRSTLEKCIAIFDRKIIEWDDKQEEIRRDAQRKADRDAQIERDRLQAIADKAAAKGQDDKAAQFQERAQTVVAPVIQAQTGAAAGVSLPKRWTFEITNAKRVNADYQRPDEVKIGKTVRALGLEAADLVGPGVRIFAEKSVASRRS